MTYIFFEAVKKVLEAGLKGADLHLRRPIKDDDTGFALAQPVVTIGWPELDLSDAAAASQRVPGLAIGLREAISDDGDARRLPIVVAAVVYSPGTLQDGQLDVGNTQGYHDLINLLDATARVVADCGDWGNGITLDDQAVRYMPDGDSLGDYWTGFVEFDLLAPAMPRENQAELL